MNTLTKIFCYVLILAFAYARSSDQYITGKIAQSIKKIDIDKLLDFETISRSIEDEYDKARFYYIVAHEIDLRMSQLDKKFFKRELDLTNTINKYEDELGINPVKYTNNKPSFDYTYRPIDITNDAIANDVHFIQAKVARSQFIQVYKYYRNQLDNYKTYLVTLRELYKCKVIQNKENSIEYFSDFPQLYQNIKVLNTDKKNNEGKMRVNRDKLGKVLNIEWISENNNKVIREREFKYFSNGLLAKLTDIIDEKIVFETIFGEHNITEDYLEYTFTTGFLPDDYNYMTEVYYNDLEEVAAYKFVSMDGHSIGTIYRQYDQNNYLVKESWLQGETSKIIREFTSIFDPTTADYKLIERDRTGNIVYQEIVLSSNE